MFLNVDNSSQLFFSAVQAAGLEPRKFGLTQRKGVPPSGSFLSINATPSTFLLLTVLPEAGRAWRRVQPRAMLQQATPGPGVTCTWQCDSGPSPSPLSLQFPLCSLGREHSYRIRCHDPGSVAVS